MARVLVLTTPGCGGCAAVERMLEEFDVEYEVIDVTEKPETLEKYPIMTAPGIVIDGKLKFVGVPRKKELLEKLKNITK